MKSNNTSGRKKIVIATACLLFLLSVSAVFSVCQAQSNQDGHKYKKILVLAKIEQGDVERNFENTMVIALKDKGYEAITAYSTFTKSELENTARLVAKADSLQVDALLAFTLTGIDTKVINTPTVTASVGVPVTIGFFSVFVGGSVPLGGGPVEEKTVNVKAGFYTDRNSTQPSWTMDLSGNLADGNDALIYSFVKKTVKALIKQKVL